MITQNFDQLGVKLEDDTVPMQDLFDLAYNDIYGEDEELSDFVECFKNDSGSCWEFIVHSEDGDNEYILTVYKNWEINFWCNDTPLHFNQYLLYKKLYELGFVDFK